MVYSMRSCQKLGGNIPAYSIEDKSKKAVDNQAKKVAQQLCVCILHPEPPDSKAR